MPSKRREAARRILSDPDARRKLMVKTIQATQAREGIETSEAQAEKAYYVVTEADLSAIFPLTKYRPTKDTQDKREDAFVRSLQNEANGIRLDVRRTDFRSLVFSPLAYEWVYILASVFRDNPPLDPSYADARQGLISTEYDRFVRYNWEVSHSVKKQWVPYAKGGDFSRFYSDLHLVFDWTNNGAEIKGIAAERYGSASRTIKCENYYFRSGITWVEKTVKGMNARILPAGAIFNVAGPSAFPHDERLTHYILGVINSNLSQACLECFSTRSWGAEYVGKIPIASPQQKDAEEVASRAYKLYAAKADWDKGNEVSTSFAEPWILREDIIDSASTVTERLDRLAEYEAQQTENIQRQYAELNNHVYHLYGISDKARATIEETLGERPPEIIWPQMEKRDADQKRIEHVCRLLSYLVKRVVAADEDGIVPFASTSGELPLLERIQREIEELFPHQAGTQTEAQIVNELRRRVKGYRRAESIAAWLEDAFFDYHVSLYERRPIIWHIASRPAGEGAAAFSALVDYPRFDRKGMAKLRGTYLRDAINHFRREAALASQEGRREDQLELQAKLEEATALDERLRLVQEGRHEEGEGNERDFRILTPWKSPQQRPVGWNPDIDDGVKVNIEPLQKASVLRVGKAA